MSLTVEDLTGGVMTEFQEKLRAQHEDSMHRELEALLGTASKAEAEISRKDFEGFKNLFHRFLQVKGPAVDWAKINRPPEESITSGRERQHVASPLFCRLREMC